MHPASSIVIIFNIMCVCVCVCVVLTLFSPVDDLFLLHSRENI